MKKYRLEIKNRINSPFKNESMRKLRVMIPNGIQLSDEDRKKMLHAEYEELMEQYQKGNWFIKFKQKVKILM
jgi:hypothetical protein